MAQSYDIQKIGIRRKTVFISNLKKQQSLVICRADKAGDLFGKYIVAHDATGGNHAFYLDDVDVTVPGDYLEPDLPAGWTAHRVPIAENASGTTIAAALATAVTALAGKFTASSVGKNLTITLAVVGAVHSVRDAFFANKKTGFGFKFVEFSLARTSIGAIEGDIEIGGMSQQMKELKIHQEGETVVDEVISGYDKPTFTVNQYETDRDSLKRALCMIGGMTMLPEVEDAEEIIGYGTALMGGRKPQFKVEIRNVDADDVDKVDDITVWKMSFNMEKLGFAATEYMSVPLEGSMFPDTSKDPMLQFFAVGDVTAIDVVA